MRTFTDCSFFLLIFTEKLYNQRYTQIKKYMLSCIVIEEWVERRAIISNGFSTQHFIVEHKYRNSASTVHLLPGC